MKVFFVSFASFSAAFLLGNQVDSLQRGLMARMLRNIVLNKHLVGPVTKSVLLSSEVSEAEVRIRLLINVITSPFLDRGSALARRIPFPELICPEYDRVEVLNHLICSTFDLEVLTRTSPLVM